MTILITPKKALTCIHGKSNQESDIFCGLAARIYTVEKMHDAHNGNHYVNGPRCKMALCDKHKHLMIKRGYAVTPYAN